MRDLRTSYSAYGGVAYGGVRLQMSGWPPIPPCVIPPWMIPTIPMGYESSPLGTTADVSLLPSSYSWLAPLATEARLR
jgi:hypothetical protein